MTPKEITYSILIFCALLIIGFAVYKHNEREDKKYEAEQKEKQLIKTNDSLKVELYKDSLIVAGLQEEISLIRQQKNEVKIKYLTKTVSDLSKSADEQGIILKKMINE